MKLKLKTTSIRLRGVQIRLASPQLIRSWAERELPNGKIVGQVTSSQTVNYQTLKPEKNGLFCERIFGPVHSFECACGKKSIKGKQFCPECNVLFTTSKLRRYQLGYIKLINPVLHIWYLKSRPSYCSILLNFTRKKTESINYCSEILNISTFSNSLENLLFKRVIYQQRSPFNRKMDRMKGVIFINSLIKPYEFTRKIQLNKFFWSIVLLNSFPVQNYLEAQYEKRSQNLFFKFKKSFISLSQPSLSLKKQFHFLSSEKKQSYKKFEKKKYKSSFNECLHSKLTKKYFRFGRHCYAASPYLGWGNATQYTHFIHYITANPEKQDSTVFFYEESIKLLLNFRFSLNTGAPILQFLLQNLIYFDSFESICLLERQIRISIIELANTSSNFFEKINLLRRLKLIWYFRKSKTEPGWLTLSILPVLPPDLRPIIQLDENQIAVSDLNKLYQKVLFRNQRIQKLKLGQYFNDSDEMQYSQRLLQESVDSLIENGQNQSNTILASSNKPLKSLSDILKGKKGRFRQNLLGKRVDYSGRSVIVVGPDLLLHECGLPKEMAIELFQPFLIRRLLFSRKVQTILGAKQLLQNPDSSFIEILNNILSNHPILLNRAPTLHRLNIQAFRPKLVDGRAILLHPLVCSSFNADFDGDQMAVHVPLSFEARSEAWKLMWSRNNLLSPATGLPILVPTQDMILGCYFLTIWDRKNFYQKILKTGSNLLPSQRFLKFKNFNQILANFNTNNVNVQTPIWISWKGFFENEKLNQKLVEIQIFQSGEVCIVGSDFQFRYNFLNKKISQIVRTTVGRILFNQLFYYH